MEYELLTDGKSFAIQRSFHGLLFGYQHEFLNFFPNVQGSTHWVSKSWCFYLSRCWITDEDRAKAYLRRLRA